MVVLEGKDGTKLVMNTYLMDGYFAEDCGPTTGGGSVFDNWVTIPELSKIYNAQAQLAGVISGSIIITGASGRNVSGGLVYGALASGDYQSTGTGFGVRVHGITGNTVNIVLTQGSGLGYTEAALALGSGGVDITEVSNLAVTILAIGR